MPISGFKPGDRVLTPSGKLATVVRIAQATPETLVVRYDHDASTRSFRAAALRFARPKEGGA